MAGPVHGCGGSQRHRVHCASSRLPRHLRRRRAQGPRAGAPGLRARRRGRREHRSRDQAQGALALRCPPLPPLSGSLAPLGSAGGPRFAVRCWGVVLDLRVGGGPVASKFPTVREASSKMRKCDSDAAWSVFLDSFGTYDSIFATVHLKLRKLIQSRANAIQTHLG